MQVSSVYISGTATGCGQRWAKDKKAGGGVKVKQEDDPGKGKKRGPVAAVEGAGPPSPVKRHKDLTQQASGEDRGTLATPAAAGPMREPKEPKLSPPSEKLGPGAQPYQVPTAAPAPAAARQPSPAPASSFVSYTIQKLTSTKGNHALFWLQDAAGGHTLAVVGTDARLSGHFTYTTSPDFTTAPPLRCTNRTEVTQWLAGFGVTEMLPEGGAGPLPELSAAERKRLLTGDPVWAKPQMDMSAWKEVREESGRLTDGRHFKRFFLLGEGGQEKLAVTGVDSHRKDRRYKYLAEETLGGFAFENSREVLDWLNFVLDRPSNDPIQPQQVRAAQALTDAELGTAAASRQPALTIRTKPPPAPRPKIERAAKNEGAGAGAGTAGGKRERGGSSRQGEDARGQDTRAETGGGAGGSQCLGGRSSSPLVLPPISGKVRPIQRAPVPRFLCACCGMTDHDSDECPLAALSPTTLIRRPTLDLSQDPSLFGMGGALGGMASPSGTLPTPNGPTTPAGVSGALEFAAGERDITPAVQATYQDYPCLRQWVAATPSAYTVETFKSWAERLGGHISDSPPPPSASPEEEPLGGWRWVPTVEALYILQELNSAQVNLALLESTAISRAVAMLRTHHNDAIARLAEAVVQKWRACAVAALHHATTALEHTK